MHRTDRIRFNPVGEILIEDNVITPTQLDSALSEAGKSGKRLGRVLIETGYASEEDLPQAVTAASNSDDPPADRKIETEVLNLITPSVCLKYR